MIENCWPLHQAFEKWKIQLTLKTQTRAREGCFNISIVVVVAFYLMSDA